MLPNPFEFELPEIPKIPDFIFTQVSVAPNVVIPNMCCGTYMMNCIKCNEQCHGSRLSESWEEFIKWVEEESKICICDNCKGQE